MYSNHIHEFHSLLIMTVKINFINNVMFKVCYSSDLEQGLALNCNLPLHCYNSHKALTKHTFRYVLSSHLKHFNALLAQPIILYIPFCTQ